jgi:uncharacterized membrane protein
MPYTIIGTDGKQYGPITADDVRRWIAEGRLNAQSMAKAENEAEFRPLSAFPEFAGLGAPKSPRPAAPPGFAGSAGWLERDYDLAIGGCISRGWELVKKNFWPSVGVSFLVMLAIAVANQIVALFSRPTMNGIIHQHHVSVVGVFILGSTSILGAPVYTVLLAGLYRYFLIFIRGGTATVGDAFSGFGPSFGQLVLLGLVQGILILIGYACCIIPGLYLSVAWFFAVPLVIDKRMGFWEAMELSRKIVNKHWFVVFAFLIVYGLLVLAGFIACCVGLLVTIPIAIAALMYAYESIFSETQNG